jgi:hypothetical protein
LEAPPRRISKGSRDSTDPDERRFIRGWRRKQVVCSGIGLGYPSRMLYFATNNKEDEYLSEFVIAWNTPVIPELACSNRAATLAPNAVPRRTR